MILFKGNYIFMVNHTIGLHKILLQLLQIVILIF